MAKKSRFFRALLIFIVYREHTFLTIESVFPLFTLESFEVKRNLRIQLVFNKLLKNLNTPSLDFYLLLNVKL